VARVYALQPTGLATVQAGALRKARRHSETHPHRDSLHYFHRFQLSEFRYNTITSRNDQVQEKLQAVVDDLDVFYVISRLRHACSTLTHQNIFQADYRIGMLDEVVAYVERSPLLENPSVALYYHAYKAFSTENPEHHFRALVHGLSTPLFSDAEMRSLYLLAINFCIRAINKGDAAYTDQLLHLYAQALEQGVLLENGQLSPFTYKNIVSAALKLTRYEWAEAFVESYRERLPEAHRHQFWAFNRAEIHLARQEFAQVVQLLAPLQYKDPFTELNARQALIKAYFELGEFKLLDYQLDNFKHLIRRRDMIGYHKANFRDFVRFMSRLVNLPPGAGPKRKRLREEITSAPILANKAWLLEKIGAA
ncbi:MAG: hypothetical protein AAF570_14310, partial [Bacteroidota bacterium]